MKNPPNLLPRKLGDTHIRLLRIFKAVVECGGFAVAEVELNISRPAISMAISELESLLEMRLCYRGRSGFSVTTEGSQVYDSTLQLLSNLELFRTQVNAIDTEMKGELNIGITDNLVTNPKMRITRAIAALKERGPKVIFNIRMMPSNEIETAILNGQLHVGVVANLHTLPGLNYEPLYSERSLLYCGKEHPLFCASDDKLLDSALVKYDGVVPAYPQTLDIKKQQKFIKVSATSTGREGIAFLILSGAYIGFLPTHVAQQWVEKNLMRAIQPETRQFYTEFSSITAKAGRANKVLQAYLEELTRKEAV